MSNEQYNGSKWTLIHTAISKSFKRWSMISTMRKNIEFKHFILGFYVNFSKGKRYFHFECAPNLAKIADFPIFLNYLKWFLSSHIKSKRWNEKTEVNWNTYVLTQHEISSNTVQPESFFFTMFSHLKLLHLHERHLKLFFLNKNKRQKENNLFICLQSK